MLHALPSITQHILCEETDLAQLKQKPLHFKCGIYLICTHGQALISTGVQQYVFEEQTELIFLTGSLIQVVQSSYDFKARILMFPQEIFLKAVLPIIIMRMNIPAIIIRKTSEAKRPGKKSTCGWTWQKCNSWTILLSSGSSRNTTFCKIC